MEQGSDLWSITRGQKPAKHSDAAPPRDKGRVHGLHGRSLADDVVHQEKEEKERNGRGSDHRRSHRTGTRWDDESLGYRQRGSDDDHRRPLDAESSSRNGRRYGHDEESHSRRHREDEEDHSRKYRDDYRNSRKGSSRDHHTHFSSHELPTPSGVQDYKTNANNVHHRNYERGYKDQHHDGQHARNYNGVSPTRLSGLRDDEAKKIAQLRDDTGINSHIRENDVDIGPKRGRSVSRESSSSDSSSSSASSKYSRRHYGAASSSKHPSRSENGSSRRRHHRSRSRSRSKERSRSNAHDGDGEKRKRKHRRRSESRERKRRKRKEKEREKEKEKGRNGKEEEKRSVLTGKKIKLKVKKDKGDHERDANRRDLLQFLNSTFE